MRHRKLTWFLALIVAGVWGSIAYQVYSSITVESKDQSVFQDKKVHMGAREAYAYVCNVRDPFAYVSAVRVPMKGMGSARLSEWIPPPLKLSGILRNGKSKTAVLERNDGDVFFVHEGDTLEGVRVLSIQDRVVHYVYRMRSSVWAIQGG